ncbi:NUDIX hydrolase [Persicobacter psychrovividus]|uniref:DNA mismatch repair protein MutT n=1 Tax=Persicobacter psychrovividus TaxID=387638 RepID=A0ABM7VET0_9BACT|nr:DNA mismatch repair protein MutT [Persicobacter psychrovividus]
MSTTHPKDQISYCPKCGGKKFPYAGKNFHCQDCGFTFYINSSAAVAAIILNEKNELLLTRRKFEPMAGLLDLPGGFVDPMESAETAVRREIKEELNLEIDQLHFFCSVPNEYTFNGLSYFTTDITFLCKVDSMEHIHAEDDISEALFIAPENIRLEDIGATSMKVIVQKYLDEHQNVARILR